MEAIGYGVDLNKWNMPTIWSSLGLPSGSILSPNITLTNPEAVSLTDQLVRNVYLPDVMNALPGVALSQTMVGGLVSADYNAGGGVFGASQIVHMLQSPNQYTLQQISADLGRLGEFARARAKRDN